MEEEINLFEYYYILKKKWKFLVVFIFVFNGLAVLGLSFWPKSYKVETVLLPVSSEKPTQFSTLAALGGLSGLMDQTSKVSNQLTVFLQSRSLAQRVIEKENLSNRFIEVQKIKAGPIPQRLEDLAALLSSKKITKVESDIKNGTIKFIVETRDSQFSYDLMNAYLRQLQGFIGDNHMTTAKRNREFIGQQLLTVQEQLLEAGKALSNYYSKYQIPAASSKIDVQISLPLSLKDKEKSALSLDFSMDQRKELIQSLTKQKEDVDEKITRLVVKDVPQQNYLEYLTLQKTLLAKLQTLLAEQYEMARIDEEKEALTFQIVDGPVFSKKESSPKKKIVLAASFFASIMLALFVAVFLHYLKVARADFLKKQKLGS